MLDACDVSVKKQTNDEFTSRIVFEDIFIIFLYFAIVNK